MTTSDNIAVTVENLSHCYGKTTALQQISLQIPQGATVGLIGPDGVGKSTLLSVIAGVKILQQGSVNLFGLDVADKKARDTLAYKVAFMPQGLGKNLYPTLSIYENMIFTPVCSVCRNNIGIPESDVCCALPDYCLFPPVRRANFPAE